MVGFRLPAGPEEQDGNIEPAGSLNVILREAGYNNGRQLTMAAMLIGMPAVAVSGAAAQRRGEESRNTRKARSSTD